MSRGPHNVKQGDVAEAIKTCLQHASRDLGGTIIIPANTACAGVAPNASSMGVLAVMRSQRPQQPRLPSGDDPSGPRPMSERWPAALRLDQAAEYCGLSVDAFLAQCPLKPLNFPAPIVRYFRARIDEWLDWRDDYVVRPSVGVGPVSGKLGVIYVAGFGPYVKIGYTAGAVEDRVSDLQTACPEQIIIYAVIPGSKAHEARLHRRFDHLRTRRGLFRRRRGREWFRRDGELAAWIDGGCK